MRKIIGFTLLEMLLVLVIMSSIILMFLNFSTTKATETQRDIVVMQTQQILNAGLSYYIANGQWPLTCGTTPTTVSSSSSNNLQPNYIPAALNTNSYGKTYQMNCATMANAGTFFVITPVDTSIDALIIAGRLPMAYVTTSGDAATNPPTQTSGCSTTGGNMPGSTCTYVVSMVNIPGQNLNNARSVNFSGVYHPGGCIPVPSCPTNMKAEVFLSVAQVMGTNDATNNGGTPNVYPITNFTTYATGPSTSPGDCTSGGSEGCGFDGTAQPSGTTYWRACMTVGTEDGAVTSGSGNNSWAQWQSIVAITRCAPTAETVGSDLSVWLP